MDDQLLSGDALHWIELLLLVIIGLQVYWYVWLPWWERKRGEGRGG